MSAPRYYHHDAPFTLENGTRLPRIDIAYHTYGALNRQRSNVVWICHALTANSDVSSWWPELVGRGKLFDPERYFIVCANVLGSPYGSTGPQSSDPHSGKPYLLDFPLITVRDMVAAHRLLAGHLGIERIFLLTGGSMGGQQALEWAIQQPERIQHAAILAANAASSPWGLAFNESQRLALCADSTFDGVNPHGGKQGLMAARSIALLSYRNFHTYQHTQAEQDCHKFSQFLAASYQRYQAEKFILRFDAYSYWSLINALDSHNIGRHKKSAQAELAKITARTLVVSITSDLLFPPPEQRYLAQHIADAHYMEMDSLYGHDGFLVETAKLATMLKAFLHHAPIAPLSADSPLPAGH
ncbi:homoserine O-acetyltransferase MetX [Brenneria tiliae]|uniref:Homoserine O-acetyltransferase n=1 Tax=Brenneria tiliae TaxID=2914984 RepID=A0ABT0MZ37_9GAMM|nr:homoserine O-acetyltransferase [Brenneria tiliae]